MGRHREFDPNEALDAAMAVFWAKGYEGTSFEDLSHATRVARPGLYRVFGNKETLYRKVLDRYEERYMGFMEEAYQKPTAYEAARLVLEGSADVQTAHPESPGCLALNGAIACSEEVEPVRREIARRRERSEVRLCGRFEAARASGDLPRSTDCSGLSAYVMAVSQGMAIQAKAGATRAKLDAIIEQAMARWPLS